MSKNNNATSKKPSMQVANVPNPPVPNRAHTEMKNGSNASKAENKAGSTNKTENKCDH